MMPARAAPVVYSQEHHSERRELEYHTTPAAAVKANSSIHSVLRPFHSVSRGTELIMMSFVSSHLLKK